MAEIRKPIRIVGPAEKYARGQKDRRYRPKAEVMAERAIRIFWANKKNFEVIDMFLAYDISGEGKRGDVNMGNIVGIAKAQPTGVSIIRSILFEGWTAPGEKQLSVALQREIRTYAKKRNAQLRRNRKEVKRLVESCKRREALVQQLGKEKRKKTHAATLRKKVKPKKRSPRR